MGDGLYNVVQQIALPMGDGLYNVVQRVTLVEPEVCAWQRVNRLSRLGDSRCRILLR